MKQIYSLDEYLDIVSNYTDSMIQREEQKKNHYTGGDCSTTVKDKLFVCFQIRMYFMNDKENRFIKKSERLLNLKNFDEETQDYLKECSRTFEILKPKEKE